MSFIEPQVDQLEHRLDVLGRRAAAQALARHRERRLAVLVELHEGLLGDDLGGAPRHLLEVAAVLAAGFEAERLEVRRDEVRRLLEAGLAGAAPFEVASGERAEPGLGVGDGDRCRWCAQCRRISHGCSSARWWNSRTSLAWRCRSRAASTA